MGRVVIEFTSPMPLERVQRENPGVLLGGRYSPPDCTPAQTVAVIIPFRHREHHLRYWLHYLHPMLRRQRLRYGVYVINQVRGPQPLAVHLWMDVGCTPSCLLVDTRGWRNLWVLACSRLCESTWICRVHVCQ